jgi:hypothetical protein
MRVVVIEKGTEVIRNRVGVEGKMSYFDRCSKNPRDVIE